MTRYHGKVGYAQEGLIVDDVWVADVVEKSYYGSVLEETRNLVPTDKVNDDISLGNRLSLVADAYAFENYFRIKYAWYNGARWRVTNVAVQRPRLILTLGGVYDGEGPKSSPGEEAQGLPES